VPAFAALGPLTGRLLLSAIFLYSGYQKLAAPARAASTIGHGLPLAALLAYAAGAVALCLGLGLRAHGVALAAFGYLAVVSSVFHPTMRGDHGQAPHPLKNAGIGGGMLLLASCGPGRFSLDRS